MSEIPECLTVALADRYRIEHELGAGTAFRQEMR
jgi:hypothetical protein